MNTVRTAAELRAALAPARRAGHRVGLVPTMGALHAGHLSLLRRARAESEVVVMSLFVNPTQFNDASDLEIYPRDENRDAELARELGVDILFAPAAVDMYPAGFATTVTVAGLTEELEGRERGRAHFDGVATVVTKLLIIVSPTLAYFGQKDAQQAAVIRRLASDLDLPVEIRICPIVRAADGLALSSRNVLLSPADRRRATALHRALTAVRDAALTGERDPESALEAGHAELTAAGIEAEYLALVDAATMDPAERVQGDLLALVAARVGATRLIDNEPIRVPEAAVNADHEVATLGLRAPTT
jgi:pantoate--beta-alanine ligase